MFKKSKHSCVFCSDLTKNSSKKINFCRDCLRIRNYLREKGISNLLELIDNSKPSAPPYN